MSTSVNWEHYSQTIQSCFDNAFSDKTYTDVTLVSEDMKNFGSHRVILSSSSKTFQDILKMSTHSHPMIFLKGFNSSDISNILKFIYKGQVELPTKDLNSFVEKAQELKLLKLQEKSPVAEQTSFDDNVGCDDDLEVGEQQKDKDEQFELEKAMELENQIDQMLKSDESEITRDIKPTLIEDFLTNDNLQLDHLLKEDEHKSAEDLDQTLNASSGSEEEGKENLQVPELQDIVKEEDKELKVKVDAMMAEVVTREGLHHCPHTECSYKVKRRELMRVHMSSTHGGPKFHCKYSSCDRIYSSRGNLRSHLKNYHKCDRCSEEYEMNKDLKKHKKAVHPNPFIRFN